MIKRRGILSGAASTLLAGSASAQPPVDPAYQAVQSGLALRFPRDHGAHPQFRTEWWYLTGWLKTARGEDLGFQVTFFRSKPAAAQANPSRFAPTQILFAHAALSDPASGRLLHDQRIARQGFGLAQAATGDADIVIDDWRLKRGADRVFRTHAGGAAFALDLDLTPTQGIVLQGPKTLAGQRLLQPAASGCHRLDPAQRSPDPRDGRGLARPRVVVHPAGPRRHRVGLDRTPS